MFSFRTRLTIIIISMVALSVVASGLLMLNTFKENHIQVLEETLEREMRLIAAQMDWVSGDNEDVINYYTNQATMLQELMDSRVTFIKSDGTVLGDSSFKATEMDNHSSREEIIGALESGIGKSIRASDTLHKSMLYVAIPITNDIIDDTYVIRLAMSLDEVEQSINSLTMVLIVGLIILFVIAALTSYRIALSLTKPLEKITQVAKRIKNMDYRARVEGIKQDEIGELGNAINAMAESLQIQMARIRQNENHLQSVLSNMINGVVMMDANGLILIMNERAENILGVSARKLIGKPYSDIKQQYELSQLIVEGYDTKEFIHEEITFYYPEERLLELNLVPIYHGNSSDFGGILLVLQDVSAIRRLERMRSEFVANVSHELKTPIAAVKGFAETLLGGAVKDEETTRSFLQIIYDESERLNRLIGDILELSKIESRRAPLMLTPVDINEFMCNTIAILEVSAIRKNIHVNMTSPEEFYMEADEDRLRQILVNLLSNAINYTPEGGTINIVISETKEENILISISDTGIGIPEKDLPRIFERFYRVDKARSRISGGTGLGLSIVKHLVELHKGTISVSSTVGVGTKFTIELPSIQ
ncbi:MAG: cell wall metabolism sensor histidine kinase WalK [Candidatus Pristimantibacillus lignocellulolyticus]|uniref:histidine kinase n=1 Tax=Candidatus Pristimantibacillus lignocellulolyticus TaxID=2994561 RepID=A0A9J6ZEN3_9BACL|nr:MAG: cell wall metabolism sensor histidine kinase WalK [Candidatus Pristimantibacillus lignocellulolyticus]